MKNRHLLILGILLALVLVLLTTAIAGASPFKPGRELTKTVLAAPIVPNDFAKPHSDAWTDFYLDKYAASSYVIRVAGDSQESLRGGLAELYAAKAKPLAPKQGIAPHSDAWNAFYFDRNVNTHWAHDVKNSNLVPQRSKGLSRWDLLP